MTDDRPGSNNVVVDDGLPSDEVNPINVLYKSTSPLIPFVVLFVLKLLFDARIELFLCIALFITCYKTDSLFLEITGMKKNAERIIRAAQLAAFLILNLLLLMLVYYDKDLLKVFLFMKPNIDLSLFTVIFYVALIDFKIKMLTMVIKCVIYILPARFLPQTFQDKGWIYATVESLSQLYRIVVPPVLWFYMFLNMHGTPQYIYNILLIILAVIFKLFQLKTIGQRVYDQLMSFGKETYQSIPVESSSAKVCPLCHGPYINSVITGPCSHVFCSKCLATWCNRDKKCPICKANLVLIPSIEYRDGHTGQYLQLY